MKKKESMRKSANTKTHDNHGIKTKDSFHDSAKPIHGWASKRKRNLTGCDKDLRHTVAEAVMENAMNGINVLLH